MLVTQPDSPDAGGASAIQIAIAAGMFLLVFAPLVVFAQRERAGRTTLLGRLADFSARVGGLPRWAALPMVIAGGSGVAALVGVYWDVPIHMEFGRDEGPLANPSHYPIYFGLVGIFASGVVSAALATRDLPARAIRIGPGWRVPRGSVLMTVTGLVGLAGFPLDDLWHRLFGQDVTEWGPTHVLMICGGISVVIGIQLLLAEARQVGAKGRGVRWIGAVTAGAWLMGTAAMLMEFDLGVPQFPMLSHVVLIALTTTWPMVVARAGFGPGGALIAVAVLLVSRVVFTAVPLVSDLHTAVLLPCVAEAVLIELVALSRLRGYRFALVSGLAVGTVGLLAEWWLSQWIMPNPWPASLLPEVFLYGVPAAVAGGVIGMWQHRRIEEVADPTPPRTRGFGRRHAAGLAGALAAVALLSAVVPPRDPGAGWTADIRLSESATGLEVSHPTSDEPERWVHATVRFTPSDITDDAVWLNGFSWQGGDFHTAPLVEVGEGVYRTAEPLPIYGNWKSGVRLHTADRVLAFAPVYAPADPAAQEPAIEPVDGPRPMISEIEFLQRERRSGVPEALWTAAYLLVGGVFALAWALFAWLYASAVPSGRARSSSSRSGATR